MEKLTLNTRLKTWYNMYVQFYLMKCYKTTFKIDIGLLPSAKLKEQSYLPICITFRTNYSLTALVISYPLKIVICKYAL